MLVRLLIAACFLALAVPGEDDDEEKFALPPRLVKLDMPNSTLGKVAPQLIQKAGLPFAFPAAAAGETCDGIFNGKPFWFALEMVAGQTGNRIAIGDNGRKIALEPRGKSIEISSVHGAFRTVAKQVVSRFPLDTGTASHEVQLDVHWEPRFPVFRLDSSPKIAKATDDKGTVLAAQAAGTRSQPTGASHSATVRLGGITREAKRIAVLEGHFTVTASEKLLAFTFDDLAQGKTAIALPVQDKVVATLKGVEKDEKTWEFQIELIYPANIPKFESFETWTSENRLRLVSPTAAKSFVASDHEIVMDGSRVVATYRFKEDAKLGLVNPATKGWKLIYEAPSPPLEFAVPFVLKDIPLP